MKNEKPFCICDNLLFDFGTVVVGFLQVMQETWSFLTAYREVIALNYAICTGRTGSSLVIQST